MGVEFRGLPQLRARLKNIQQGKAIMEKWQTDSVYEAKKIAPRKSSNLSRSIQPGYLARTEALVVAKANYARGIEEGTGLYGPKHKPITPKNGKYLVFPAKGKATLGGRLRSQHIDKTTGKAKRGALVFVTSVKGRKATPFLKPGAEKARSKGGLKDAVVQLWNEAA